MVLCVTGLPQIERLLAARKETARANSRWRSETIADVVLRQSRIGEMGAELLVEQDGAKAALLFIAADPCSCTSLGELFCLSV